MMSVDTPKGFYCNACRQHVEPEPFRDDEGNRLEGVEAQCSCVTCVMANNPGIELVVGPCVAVHEAYPIEVLELSGHVGLYEKGKWDGKPKDDPEWVPCKACHHECEQPDESPFFLRFDLDNNPNGIPMHPHDAFDLLHTITYRRYDTVEDVIVKWLKDWRNDDVDEDVSVFKKKIIEGLGVPKKLMDDDDSCSTAAATLEASQNRDAKIATFLRNIFNIVDGTRKDVESMSVQLHDLHQEHENREECQNEVDDYGLDTVPKFAEIDRRLTNMSDHIGNVYLELGKRIAQIDGDGGPTGIWSQLAGVRKRVEGGRKIVMSLQNQLQIRREKTTLISEILGTLLEKLTAVPEIVEVIDIDPLLHAYEDFVEKET